jgi:CheY-like chemotaxis protein
LSILLAEDSRVNQAVAIGLLKKRGDTVTLAETGLAALEAVGKQTFDLVLMDVQMPEMDAYRPPWLSVKGKGPLASIFPSSP